MSVIEDVTEHQTRARAALETALRDGPSHAYLLIGPNGSGKTVSARAFAAEVLASGSADPGETRRRALLDPSPHPDLIWLRPVGMSHAVADVRDRLIQRAPLRPFEGEHRVFVIEAADALNEESQNAMLKTLEEPPPHAHLVLIAADAEAVLPTVVSRCQTIEFDAPPEDSVISQLGSEVPAATARAAARLARGDVGRARLLVSDRGGEIRSSVEAMLTAVSEEDFGASPWLTVLAAAKRAGEMAGEEVSEALSGEAEEGAKHSKSEIEEATRRAQRRARTEVLDLSLSLAASWVRDWSAIAAGAEEVVFNVDRLEVLREQSARIPLARARDSVEVIADTRRRLELNVSEELALEALCFRLARLIAFG